MSQIYALIMPWVPCCLVAFLPASTCKTSPIRQVSKASVLPFSVYFSLDVDYFCCIPPSLALFPLDKTSPTNRVC